MVPAYQDLARRIDHSALGPTLTEEDLEAACHVAREYQVASICIKPFGVPMAKRILAGSSVAVSTTIGFPHGGHTTATKVDETYHAIDEGAVELDMVINIGQAIGGNWDAVKRDIAAVTEACHKRKAIIKVIFENCFLSPAQITKLCKICGDLNCDYIKTSTGYGTGGATENDLRLMRETAPPHVKLKAAGGIRTLDAALKMVELGCDRIGATKTAEILAEYKKRFG